MQDARYPDAVWQSAPAAVITGSVLGGWHYGNPRYVAGSYRYETNASATVRRGAPYSVVFRGASSGRQDDRENIGAS